jgi:hypothetical protein
MLPAVNIWTTVVAACSCDPQTVISNKDPQ